MAYPRAVLFDLDGTLVHSVPDLRIAANKLLQEEGRPLLEDAAIATMVGNGVRKLVERVFRATGGEPATEEALEALVERFLGHYEAHPADLTRPFDGVAEALAVLHGAGVKLGVCTNKPTVPSREILDILGLAPFLQVVIGGGATPHLKPHPAPVVAALEALGVRAEETVFVGDSPNDAEAARAAGLRFVAVPFGYRRCTVEDLQADRVVDTFHDLAAALQEI